MLNDTRIRQSKPRVPRLKAEHMAAPTKAPANVKKVLANSEPSTHDRKQTIISEALR
jgi:hypothetical protein